MRSINLLFQAFFVVFILSSLSVAQTATCTGWTTFKVGSRFNTQGSGINKYNVVVGGTGNAYGVTSPAPAFTRRPKGGIATFRYDDRYTTFSHMDSQGVTVGYYEDASSHFHGIAVYGSKTVTINYPKASDTYPLGINDGGTIVGEYLLPGSNNSHGFEFKNGKFYSIDYPHAVQTVIHGINNNNVMVGYQWQGTGVYEGFVLANGKYTTIKDPNATGATFPSDINNAGTIVGDYFKGVNPQSFIYSAGAFKDIDVPNANPYADTYGINDNNYVTGEVYVQNGGSSGFIAHCD